jgi:hypothetical protein
MKIALTTKLTTEQLDVFGRRWAMRRQNPWISGDVGRF